MTYKIKKYRHRAWPPRIGIYFNKQEIRRQVCFDLSCKYDLQGEDQLDTNKLFGIGYFPGHHKESARFGWRWDSERRKIILSAYCYVNGGRVMIDLCDIFTDITYRLTILILPFTYEFHVEDMKGHHRIAQEQVHHSHKKRFGFPLGIFFGGNKTAPHDMFIKMKKA